MNRESGNSQTGGSMFITFARVLQTADAIASSSSPLLDGSGNHKSVIIERNVDRKKCQYNISKIPNILTIYTTPSHRSPNKSVNVRRENERSSDRLKKYGNRV
jgi:hypothetical protein